jgi:hypothetical protein
VIVVNRLLVITCTVFLSGTVIASDNDHLELAKTIATCTAMIRQIDTLECDVQTSVTGTIGTQTKKYSGTYKRGDNKTIISLTDSQIFTQLSTDTEIIEFFQKNTGVKELKGKVRKHDSTSSIFVNSLNVWKAIGYDEHILLYEAIEKTNLATTAKHLKDDKVKFVELSQECKNTILHSINLPTVKMQTGIQSFMYDRDKNSLPVFASVEFKRDGIGYSRTKQSFTIKEIESGIFIPCKVIEITADASGKQIHKIEWILSKIKGNRSRGETLEIQGFFETV